MTAPLAAPAPAGGAESAGEGLALCRLCRAPYKRKRANQDFCQPAHKREWERLQMRALRMLGPAVREMVERLREFEGRW